MESSTHPSSFIWATGEKKHLFSSVPFRSLPPELWEINFVFEPSIWDDGMVLHFAIKKADKLYASRQHKWNREECLKLRIFHRSIELEFLEVFWDTYIGTFWYCATRWQKSFGDTSLCLYSRIQIVWSGWQTNGWMLFWIIQSIDLRRFNGPSEDDSKM